MKKLFNKKPILKKKKKIKFVTCPTYSLKIISNFIFLKKWYKEKYCSNLNFLVTALNKIPKTEPQLSSKAIYILIVLTTNPPAKALQAVTKALRRRTGVTPLALAFAPVSLEPKPLLILILPGCCVTSRDFVSSSSSICCYFIRDKEREEERDREKIIKILYIW